MEQDRLHILCDPDLMSEMNVEYSAIFHTCVERFKEVALRRTQRLTTCAGEIV